LQAIKAVLKKKIALLLLCIVPYCIMVGCMHDKLSDEEEEDNPYVRAETCRRLIQACKENMVLEERRASFDITKTTYKNLDREYKKFSLKAHPDKKGVSNSEKFAVGAGAWQNLNDKLISYGYSPEDLKKVTQGLFEYLQTHPSPK
jgi:hypothetical protein